MVYFTTLRLGKAFEYALNATGGGGIKHVYNVLDNPTGCASPYTISDISEKVASVYRRTADLRAVNTSVMTHHIPLSDFIAC